MQNLRFFEDKKYLQTEYDGTRWVENSGLPPAQLQEQVNAILRQNKEDSALLLRAKLFSCVLSSARVGFDEHDVFFDHVDGENLVDDIRKQQTESLLLSNALSKPYGKTQKIPRVF